PGQGQGLSQHFLGEMSGSETVTLLESEMPSHAHTLMGNVAPGDGQVPTDSAVARTIGASPYLPPAGAPLVQLAFQSLAPAGGSSPHNNMMPYLVSSF